MFLCVGTGSLNLFIAAKITDKILKIEKNAFYFFIFFQIPSSICECLHSEENLFRYISENLRIYKINNKIYFNPPKVDPNIASGICKLSFLDKSGKFKYTHYTLGHKGDGINAHAQLTGNLQEEMRSFPIVVDDYKKPFTNVVYNRLQHSSNLRNTSAAQHYKNLHLKNERDILNLQGLI
jgi:hypothetical protein